MQRKTDSQRTKLLTEGEAAEQLGLKPGTLAIWRCTHRYPLAFIKIGRNVRYSQESIDAFIQAGTVRPTTALPFNTEFTE